jgi:hypothetical protein
VGQRADRLSPAPRPCAGLENALKLEGLAVADVELVDYPYGGTGDDAKQHLYGAEVSLDTSRFSRRNNELIGLLRGDIDAIFLKVRMPCTWPMSLGCAWWSTPAATRTR